MELVFGIALMVLGAVIFLAGRTKSKTVHVEASNGSVAIGGKNSGRITNTNIGAQPAASHGSHWLTVVSIVVELAGIGLTVWHLAAK